MTEVEFEELPPLTAYAMAMSAMADRVTQNKLARYKPYAKQKEFHRAGADHGVRERLLMAGNQLGKTVAGSFEAAMHLTGRYPADWEGVRFDDPTSGWAASTTSKGTRDTVQRMLLGKPGEWGTGAIPLADIVEIKKSASAVPDTVDSVTVRHHSTGGLSRVGFMTYDQGRERWQGETLNWVWFDEEPPMDIYLEGLTRTNATHGVAWMTFTPLLGMSTVVKRFLVDKAPGTHVTKMTINDAEHYTQAERDAIIASYPAHERSARAMGIPILGSGRIFPVEEERLKETSFSIPAYWPRICGMDFGWTHPTANVWIAYDRDNDVAHVYEVYRVSEASPVVHAAAIKSRGAWIPVAWPHDGENDTAAGDSLANQYRAQQVNMMKARATFPPKDGEKEGTGGNSVEAGLLDMLDRMMTGRLKVAAHLNDWWEEFRLYHRKDGKVVKLNDDLLSATRYGLMMLRHAAVAKPVVNVVRVHNFVPSDSTMGPLG